MSLDTKVKNLIINTNMTKEQYEAIDDKSNQLFFVEDSSVVDVPAPEENQSGYLHTDGENLTWKEIEVDNFLPLSGGTIDGDLTIKSSGSSTVEPLLTLSYGSSDVVIKKVRYGKELDFDNTKISGLAGVVPTQSTGQLGASGAFWSKAYIRNLNAGAPNGKDLLVPSKAGTLATLEDIPEDTQLETLPVASADNLNKIYQYVGETTSDYVNGYFYKCEENITITLSMMNSFVSSGASATLDSEKFASQNPIFADIDTSNTPYPAWRADYQEGGTWNVWTQTPNLSITTDELASVWGITISRTPEVGDMIAVMQQEEINYHWEEINFSEDCLPLGGGTLTGPLNISGTILSSKYDNELKIGLVGVDEIITMNLASGSIISVTDSGSLGSGAHKWKTVYTTKLNNGADLALPTEGGTLARLEDIDTVMGDISTTLTAILGE